MPRQQLENYADVLLDKYAPRSKEAANYELKNNVHERKLHEIEALIMEFPQDIHTSIKEQVANMAKEKLIAVYDQFSK